MTIRAFRAPLSRLLAAIALVGAALVSRGQEASAQEGVTKPTVSFKIITNDEIGVHVFGEDNLTKVARVDARGEINCVLIGDIRIGGMTIEQAEKAIADAYRNGQFLLHPNVTLSVEGLAPREVSVQGMVKTPGRYDLKIESGTTLIDIISKAGSFTDTAQGKAVRVTRYEPDGPHVFTIDVESVIRGKETDRKKIEAAHMLLEPGDLIYVPERII